MIVYQAMHSSFKTRFTTILSSCFPQQYLRTTWGDSLPLNLGAWQNSLFEVVRY